MIRQKKTLLDEDVIIRVRFFIFASRSFLIGQMKVYEAESYAYWKNSLFTIFPKLNFQEVV